METLLVGGAVRDGLLKTGAKDRDYVILNSSTEELVAKGFTQVGTTYPIFLHPRTGAECVLVSDLELDLRRRDFTINAMAQRDDGTIIDLASGRDDLKNKVLRHVSESTFSDDPLRIYRLARFKAELPEFSIAAETLELARRTISCEKLREIPPERVFHELRKSLHTDRPSVFFETLRDLGLLQAHYCELARLVGVPQRVEYHPEGDAWVHTMLVLDHSVQIAPDLPTRYAALVHDLGKGVTRKELLPRHIGHEESGLREVKRMSERLKVPGNWVEAALVVTRHHLKVHRLGEMKANSIVRMFYQIDAFRQPQLVQILAGACKADELGKNKNPLNGLTPLEACFQCVRSISAKDLTATLSGKAIGDAIRALRVRRLKDFLKGEPSPLATRT
ncbi:MAG TPA: HD domain-containing protein [Bacteriovoracaceae bacterium]|nr:HD domain-containing protein [Bacteriovoracaceae bacterium]